jgi:formylglycine-generating enzyme required for sulfatase activity
MPSKHRAWLLAVCARERQRCRGGSQSFVDCEGCPEMIVLPGGTFRMGTDTGPQNERPRTK